MLDGHNGFFTTVGIVINPACNKIVAWSRHVWLISVLLSVFCLLSCSKTAETEIVPLTIGSSYVTLIPQLGWSESGVLDPQMVNAKSIVFEGRTLERTQYYPPMVGVDGKRRLIVTYEDDMWYVSIWACARGIKGKDYIAQSVVFGMNQLRNQKIRNTERPPITLPMGVIIGRSTFDTLPDIRLGKPIIQQRILNSAFWSATIAEEPVAVRFDYDSGNTLIGIGFIQLGDQS